MDEGLLSRGSEGVEISTTTSYAALPPGHTEQPTAKSWRACAVLAVSVLLSMSTWLSASVVLPYLEAYFRIDEDDAPLLTCRASGGAGPSRPSRRAPPSRSPACSGSTRASGAKAGWRCRPRR